MTAAYCGPRVMEAMLEYAMRRHSSTPHPAIVEIAEEVAPHVVDFLGGEHGDGILEKSARKRRGGDRRYELMVDVQGVAAMTATIQPNGTVVTEHRRSIPEIPGLKRAGRLPLRQGGVREPQDHLPHITRAAADNLMHLLAETIWQSLSQESADRLMQRSRDEAAMGENIYKTTDWRDITRAVRRAAAQCILDSFHRTVTAQGGVHHENNLHVISQRKPSGRLRGFKLDVVDLARDVESNPYTSTHDGRARRGCEAQTYNFVALNHEIVREMWEKDPAVIAMYCRAVLPGMAPDQVQQVKHSGVIAKALQQWLNLTRAEWRAFRSLHKYSGPIFRYEQPVENGSLIPWAPVRELTAMSETDIDNIVLACQAVAEANHPAACRNSRLNVLEITESHETIRYMEAHHRGIWKRWIHVLNRYLVEGCPADHPENQCPRAMGEYVIRDVADALEAYADDDRHWSRSDWATYQRRGRTVWVDSQAPENEHRSWHTATSSIETLGYRLKAINNEDDLLETATKLRNCLYRYANACASGNTVIFAITKNDETVGAAEIIREGEQWRMGQIAGPENAEPTPEMIRVSRIALRAYGEEDRRA